VVRHRKRHYLLDTRRIKRNAYMASSAWVAVQQRKLSQVSFCERCFASKDEWRLDVHHKHYRSLGNEAMRDLAVLCRPCHTRLHDIQHRYGYTVEEATDMFMSGDIITLLIALAKRTEDG
jgi:5-methylcytosine-specific restriction endonuclease McrA